MSDRISWSDGLHRYALVPWLADHSEAEVLCPDRAMLVLRRNLETLGAEEVCRAMLEADSHPSALERVFELLQRRRWVVARVPLNGPTVHHDLPIAALADASPPPPSTDDRLARPPADVDDEDTATFVSFTLYDDHGVPVPDWDFCLELPDGTSVTQRTDAMGTFEVDPVAVAGSCVLRAVA